MVYVQYNIGDKVSQLRSLFEDPKQATTACEQFWVELKASPHPTWFSQLLAEFQSQGAVRYSTRWT